MSTPVKTPIEAKVAHVVGTVLGILAAVVGFLASHKGAVLPSTGLTVGGIITIASQWRYVRVVEGTVASAVAWEKEHANILTVLRSNLSPLLSTLLPANLTGRLSGVESDAAQALAVAKKSVDVDGIAQRVVATLAATAVTPAAAPAASVTPQAVESVPASSFIDPPVVTS